MQTSFKIKENWLERVENLISGTETVSLFCYKAMEEKVKRMEARNERARLQLAAKDKSILEPIMIEILTAHGLIND